MGCDIHGWVEIKKNNKWVAIFELKTLDRNYKRFAALAGVRDYHNENQVKPLGLPEDISDTAKYWSEHWGLDGHSHNYMTLEDAAKIFLETEHQPDTWAKKYPLWEFFKFENDTHQGDTRLVFWFDN